MRIVAGSRKGHRIAAPKGVVTRPTSDRVREAVFSIVGSVEGAAVLDLFAGSGAMGLEALSRGAARCVFVDRDPQACRIIEQNLRQLRLTRGTKVVRSSVATALGFERHLQAKYALALADPPYGAWQTHAPVLAEYLPGLVEEGGLVVVETSKEVEPELPLRLVSTRRYGSARITVFSA